MLAGAADAALDEVKTNMERVRAPSHKKDIALRQYLDASSEDQRALKIARYAVQKFAHGLIADMNDSREFQLVAKSSTGELLDLKRYSDLFAAETGVWFQKYIRARQRSGRSSRYLSHSR